MVTKAVSVLECSLVGPLAASIALSRLMDAARTHKATGYLIFAIRVDKMDMYRSNFPSIDSFI